MSVADRISNKEFGATSQCTDNTRQFVYMEYESRIRDFILTPVLRQCGTQKCGSSSNKMSGTKELFAVVFTIRVS